MVAEAPSYLIVGDGRWARVIRDILTALNRSVRVLKQSRRGVGEDADDFKERLVDQVRASGVSTAWVCVPPCSDLPLIVESAIIAGLHTIVEKPWVYSHATTAALAELARLRRVLVAIHFQYCFLERIEALRLRADTLVDPQFSGTFTLSRHDRIGLPALYNLGSHLLAVREYAIPRSRVSVIHCAYDDADERFVRVESSPNTAELISLMTKEPIIQRFVAKFEEATASLDFPLDLRFASSVLDALNAVRGFNST